MLLLSRLSFKKIWEIWEKINQCFGSNEENRTKKIITKTIIKEFKRLTEVNLFSMTTNEIDRDIINEYLNHDIGPPKFSIY